MKPGLATIALRRYNVFHAIDLAAQAGFAGVEIWGKPPHTPEEFDADHTAKIRDRVRAYGMKVSMFGSYVRPGMPDFETKAEEAIKIAKILGTRRIRVWAGNKEPHEADDNVWQEVARKLREFALQAEDYGMILAMEMHGGTLCATPEGCLRVIEMCNSPNLKINFQVLDPRNPDLERTIGLLGRYVVNVHAQNYRPSRREPDKLELCLIQEGLVDYDKALSLLAEQGFNGFVEAEFLKGESESEDVMLDSLRKDAQYLCELTAKYRRED
ncbi:MAG: sugar phosphate isomerase/epimerase family protein [Armatimonadota bacterium]|nr:sugar phosphate isomerase/epimerase family protein [Armatimonadota bacterium]